ncbi:MAG: molybdopterin-dependent oxidoreductase [Cyclobacteriaceae bacterium]|nr:molybdopterin-dependent oxidoreductase [Cyclobacteriaceae bacterium HetDA_MAG_MS6]
MSRGEYKKTTCSYCGVGCGIEARVTKKGKVEIRGDESHPVNKGMLCSKGMNLHYTVMDQSDRLLHPQLKWSKNHPLEKVDWDTAISRAAAVFKSLISRHGPDSVGFYVSGQCLTEEYYLVNKLTKGFIGTNNLDTNSRLCMSSAVVGYKQCYGEDAVPISYEDIELADCFLIAGANPAWCHPILFRRIEKHKADNPHVKLVVVDPRVTDSCALADLHLQITPGTDTVLFQAIGRCLIENGYTDQAFIADHTDGFELYRKEVLKRSLQEAAAICDVSIEDIILASRYIGQSSGFISMWAMGLNQSTGGVNKNLALLNLSTITGKIGKPGNGPFSLTGQPNAMGGREVGGMANLLAVHKDLANPQHRQEVAEFWNVSAIQPKPGLTATEMFQALADGQMKAIWIICTNPSVSMPNARLVDEALSKAPFVVVQDISQRSDTIQYADLVLPAAAWLEKEGTMTNSDRRISYLHKLIEPPGQALPDTEILMRFAKTMGFLGFDFDAPKDIYQEYSEMTRGTRIDVTGLNHDILKSHGTKQWPVPEKNHPGTKRLFEDKVFYTSNGRAQIKCVGPEIPHEPLNQDRPLILTTGRIRDQWHTMTRTGKVNKLKRHISRPFVEIHPIDASNKSIKNNDPVRIVGLRGEVVANAKLTENIKQGVVFLPMHWGKMLSTDESRANNITSDEIDPQSKQPGFKYAAVDIQKVAKPAQKIVIVGAGAASFRFINTYRELNPTDEIHIFSKEEWPFYNRVLLPDYVNETKSWEDLLKFKYGEMEQLNIQLYRSNPITAINSSEQTITDSKGEVHTYDKLVLATGSRAFVPPAYSLDHPRIMTMRDRQNADQLKAFLTEKSHVSIIGGGLLGLELAAALTEIDMEVTIIQLGSRLMERQLDPMASSLLREYIEEELEVKILTNEEVTKIQPDDERGNLTISLKSGKSFICDATVFAIGTRPNVEMAKDAGLEVSRGVVVNDYLQSSDPDIFALGEIAEHQQKLNGVTLAAEQQADCCARYICGDASSYYQGTTPMNILKFPGLDLCSIGLVEVTPENRSYEEVIFLDRSALFYKKCIIQNDKLVGAILLGDKSEFAEFKELITDQIELSEKRLQILRSGKAQDPVLGTLICSCNNVGAGNINQAILGGCDSLNELCAKTGAGLGCGSCKPEIKRILDQATVVV